MRYMILYGIFSLLLHLQVAAAHGDNPDYEIIQYNLSIRIPETYDRVEVGALMCLEKLASGSGNRVRFTLGDNFRGAKAVNLEVTDVQNEPLSFTFDDTLLNVDLSDVFRGNRTSWVLLQYDLIKDEAFFDEYSLFSFEICDSLCHINASITRTDNWYPKIEGTMAKRLPPYKLMIDVPVQFEVMASGSLVDVVTEQDRKVYTWQNYEGITDRSLYFFAQKTEKVVKAYEDSFRVIMYVPDSTMPENIDYLADVIHKTYQYFETMYGEAPWNEYKIMAFPYGYSGLFNSMCAPVELFTSAITNNDICFPTRSVIHEVSHTWWGNIVSSNADENYWLYEGFGKYSEIIGIKPALGVDVESLSFCRLQLCTRPYIEFVPSIQCAQDSDDRVLVNAAAYYMGATYLKMLRLVMSDEMFYDGIRDYVQRSRGKCITTNDFLAAMEKHCGRQYHEMLVDYLDNPGYARYELTRSGTVHNNECYVHNYEIRNVGNKDIFVPYKVNSDMENYTSDLFLKKGESYVFHIKSKRIDASVVVMIDPEEIYPICQAGLKGPGATVYSNEQGEVKAYSIISGGPFANAGVNEDMSLISIDSENLASKDLRTLNNMMLRPEGTAIKLLVKEGDAQPREVTVIY